MSGNAKFRWFLLAPILVALLVVVSSPVVSSSGSLDDYQLPRKTLEHIQKGGDLLEEGKFNSADIEFKKAAEISPDSPEVFALWGTALRKQKKYKGANRQFAKAIKLAPNDSEIVFNWGISRFREKATDEAIKLFHKTVELSPSYYMGWYYLGKAYGQKENYDEEIKHLLKVTELKPDFGWGHFDLAIVLSLKKRYEEAVPYFEKAIAIDKKQFEKPFVVQFLAALGRYSPTPQKNREKKKTEPVAVENRQRQAQAKPAPPVRQATSQPPAKKTPQSGTGSGFFVSKMGHVITNAHVVQNCKKITIGDNAYKQVPAELINTDRSNDLALLKLSTLEMASAESKSLIQKLGIVVVPLASKGLLRSEDVRLGEKVLVAGYPFGEFFSNTIKVTVGVVSATRGAGDDSGQFQLDAAVQPGNSGGPIYDSGGNIVGVVISQLNKRMMEKAIGSMPENMNFGIKASTVRQFLKSSGLPSKKSERTEEKSTEKLAEIAKNQALMVMCLQTESFEQTAESIAEERKKLEKEREQIAALQNLQEVKQKLEEERRLFQEEQDRLVRLQPKKRITFPPEYNQALHSYRSGNYDECILRLRSVLSTNPPERLKDNINYWIGSCYSKLEMYEDAIEILQSVLLKNPPAELRNKILKRLNDIGVLKGSENLREEQLRKERKKERELVEREREIEEKLARGVTVYGSKYQLENDPHGDKIDDPMTPQDERYKCGDPGSCYFDHNTFTDIYE